jgi:hypothetical protein
MTSAEEARVINGIVRDEAGTPTPGIVVSLTSGPVALPDIAALTGVRGEFALSAPVSGEYVVTVSYPDGHQEARVVDVTDEERSVELDISR